jgi:hypothetical protein
MAFHKVVLKYLKALIHIDTICRIECKDKNLWMSQSDISQVGGWDMDYGFENTDILNFLC